MNDRQKELDKALKAANWSMFFAVLGVIFSTIGLILSFFT